METLNMTTLFYGFTIPYLIFIIAFIWKITKGNTVNDILVKRKGE